ncbi:lytic transglycosylase domain-containing protein [Actinokineospora sp. 24-640]
MLTADPPRKPGRRRALLRLALVIALVAVAGLGVVVLERLNRPDARPSRPAAFVVPPLAVEPGSAAPQGRPAPVEPDLAAWAERLSKATDIPARTLLAYVNAEMATRRTTPACHIAWTTLAGIGRVESHHGRYNGTAIGADGRLSKPIIGIPLDGSPGIRAIPDTDGGRLDGDTTWDRAVGPMQFLPTTWARWALRANADGTPADPQNVDDAALTAARYLCASGGDLATGEGWWKAVLTYNRSNRYARDVFSGADAYARKAEELVR